MKTNKLLSLLSAFTFMGVLGVAGPALAGAPNNTPATATPLGVVPPYTAAFPGNFIVADDTLTNVDDVDWFSFTLAVPSRLLAFTLSVGDSATDTFMELFREDLVNFLPAIIDPTALASNDNCQDIPFCDFVPTYGLFNTDDPFSAFDPTDPAVTLPAGNYFIAISLGGQTEEIGEYNLVLSSDPLRSDNVVPEPASLLLLGSGLAGLAIWRRNRA